MASSKRRNKQATGDIVQLTRNIRTPNNELQFGCTMTKREAEKRGLVEVRDYEIYTDRQTKPDDVTTRGTSNTDGDTP